MNYQVGATVGDYQVVGVLGAGGMGEVYKVRNIISDRIEAMKVLLADLAQYPELADRFLREIKVQASLKHPNIAGLHTALRVDNQLLMLIEYVEGVTLEQQARQHGPLTVPQAVDYIGQVLSALEYAHGHGVVHRDIKPANMMLMQGGVVKLMDFGIAKASTDRQLTAAGSTIGSLYYMSPEQIQGSASIDGRSDLYSVGVSLYELVTGKRPFDGDSQYAIMAAHLEKVPVPPIVHDPKLPQTLNDIILMSVTKDPNARFQSAAAFRNALSKVVAPVSVAPPPKPANKGSSRRGIWMGAGAVATVAAIIAVVQLAPHSPTKAAPTVTPANKVLVEQPKPEAPKVQPPVVTAPEPVSRATPQAVKPTPGAPQTSGAVVAPPIRASAQVQTRAADPVPPPQQAQTGASVITAPPIQLPPPTAASVPNAANTPSAPSRAEMQAAREQAVLLGTRAGVVRTGLQTIERSQAAKGLNLRADMREAEGLMASYLEGVNAALAAGDVASAHSFMDKAERQIEKLEKFLGR